ncbi:hypothetical protein HHX47_DHR6000724 [Lentinula edodes]|nr:hypothetical protein HHX47_DHR6000724 [Lentinula edodes]
MRSSLVFVALASTSLARYHAPLDIHQDPESTEAIVFSLSALNNHGAPIPPKSFGSRPGWYLGDDPASADGLPWLRDMDLCASLAQSANAIKCPPIKKSATKTLPKRSVSAAPTTTAATTQSTSTPSYYTIFSGLDGAIEGSGYLTYGLVDTISGRRHPSSSSPAKAKHPFQIVNQCATELPVVFSSTVRSIVTLCSDSIC